MVWNDFKKLRQKYYPEKFENRILHEHALLAFFSNICPLKVQSASFSRTELQLRNSTSSDHLLYWILRVHNVLNMHECGWDVYLNLIDVKLWLVWHMVKNMIIATHFDSFQLIACMQEEIISSSLFRLNDPTCLLLPMNSIKSLMLKNLEWFQVRFLH